MAIRIDRFADREADIDRHHDMFRAELPKLIGPRGRLVVARRGDEPLGAGALNQSTTLSRKSSGCSSPRAPAVRGVARSLLERLLADARALGCTTARLETADFMTEAQARYRSLESDETAKYDGSETATCGIDVFMVFMEVPLDSARRPAVSTTPQIELTVVVKRGDRSGRPSKPAGSLET